MTCEVQNLEICMPNIEISSFGINFISIYTLSDLGYSSNLIGSLSRANAALFTRYRVDNALSHKTKQNGRRKLAFR